MGAKRVAKRVRKSAKRKVKREAEAPRVGPKKAGKPSRATLGGVGALKRRLAEVEVGVGEIRDEFAVLQAKMEVFDAELTVHGRKLGVTRGRTS
jgi:hypothetical protein